MEQKGRTKMIVSTLVERYTRVGQTDDVDEAVLEEQLNVVGVGSNGTEPVLRKKRLGFQDVPMAVQASPPRLDNYVE